MSRIADRLDLPSMEPRGPTSERPGAHGLALSDGAGRAPWPDPACAPYETTGLRERGPALPRGGGQGEDGGVDRRISGAHSQDAIASTGQRSMRSPPGGAVLKWWPRRDSNP